MKNISLCSSWASSNSSRSGSIQKRREDSVPVSHYKSNKLMHSVRLNFNCSSGHWALGTAQHWLTAQYTIYGELSKCIGILPRQYILMIYVIGPPLLCWKLFWESFNILYPEIPQSVYIWYLQPPLTGFITRLLSPLFNATIETLLSDCPQNCKMNDWLGSLSVSIYLYLTGRLANWQTGQLLYTYAIVW